MSLSVLLLSTSALAETVTAATAVQRAATHNPNLRAVLHDLKAANLAIAVAEQVLTPTLFLGVNGAYNERFGASSRGVTRNEDQSITGETGVRVTTPIGTAIEVGVSNGVSWRTSNLTVATTESVTVGPNYAAELYSTVRQPILRGAGEDGVMAPTRQAQASHAAAEHQRDQAASELCRDVLTAYWELWYAERAVGVQEAALALADKQLKDAQLSAELLGNTATVETLRFGMEVANVQESLAGAKATRATRAVQLGQLLSLKPGKSLKLAPTADAPSTVSLPPLDEILARARKISPELKALDKQIDAAREEVIAARDANQPQLDVVLGVSMGGLWQSATIATLALPGDRPAFTAMLGIELEVPLGPGVGSPQAARATAQLNAAQARYDARVQALDAEIAGLSITVENAANTVALTTTSAELARKLAEAERERYTLGSTTPQEVVRAQQTHRETELRRLRAMVDHVNAQVALEHRTARLVARFADAVPKALD